MDLLSLLWNIHGLIFYFYFVFFCLYIGIGLFNELGEFLL